MQSDKSNETSRGEVRMTAQGKSRKGLQSREG
jgi:hypothetical protein